MICSYSQTPFTTVGVEVHGFDFSQSSDWLWCVILVLIKFKTIPEKNGPAASWTRVSSVQTRYSTTGLQAHYYKGLIWFLKFYLTCFQTWKWS